MDQRAAAPAPKKNSSGCLIAALIVGLLLFSCAAGGVAVCGIGAFIYMRNLEDAKRDIAKTNIENLSMVVEAYKVKNGEYPANLVGLTEVQPDGSKAYLDQSALLDPWQQPYIYEPENRHPTNDKPRIYSYGGAQGNQAGWISNW